MTRSDLIVALSHPNVAAFLRVLREGESSQDDSAYTVLWGGSHFEGFADHPRKHFPLPGGQTTSAAGAYQITETTWNALVKQFGFEDFSPGNQDQAAVALIAGRKALPDVIAGRLYAAIRRLPLEWTSLALPKRQAQAAEVFLAYGGTLADETPQTVVAPVPIVTPQVKPMGIFGALLPTILQLLPQLIPVFSAGHNSDEAKMWQGAGMVVANTLQTATGTDNLVQAVAAMQKDPELLAAAHDAVNDLLPQLMEAGSGGIDGARKSALALAETPLARNTPFLVTCMFYPLIVAVVLAALLDFPWLAKLSNETRSMVIGFVMGVIAGSIISFFFGTTKDSSKKTDLLAAK